MKRNRDLFATTQDMEKFLAHMASKLDLDKIQKEGESLERPLELLVAKFDALLHPAPRTEGWFRKKENTLLGLYNERADYMAGRPSKKPETEEDATPIYTIHQHLEEGDYKGVIDFLRKNIRVLKEGSVGDPAPLQYVFNDLQAISDSLNILDHMSETFSLQLPTASKNTLECMEKRLGNIASDTHYLKAFAHQHDYEPMKFTSISFSLTPKNVKNLRELMAKHPRSDAERQHYESIPCAIEINTDVLAKTEAYTGHLPTRTLKRAVTEDVVHPSIVSDTKFRDKLTAAMEKFAKTEDVDEKAKAERKVLRLISKKVGRNVPDIATYYRDLHKDGRMGR